MKIIIVIIIFFVSSIKINGQDGVRPFWDIRDNYIDHIYLGRDTFYFNRIPPILISYYSRYIDFESNLFILKMMNELSIHTLRSNNYQEPPIMFFTTRRTRDGYLFINKHFAAWLNTQSDKNENLVVWYRVNDVKLSTKEDAERLVRLRKRRIKDVSVYRNEVNEVVIDVILK